VLSLGHIKRHSLLPYLEPDLDTKTRSPLRVMETAEKIATKVPFGHLVRPITQPQTWQLTTSLPGLPLVRHLPNPPLPAPHPPTPRRSRPNLEHRILQRTRLRQIPHSLGKSPPISHSILRRLAAAVPPREVARCLPQPGQQLAVEIADSGRWAAFLHAAGRGEGGVDGLVDEGETLGEVQDSRADCCA
jgi:hypothetical protein